MAEGLQRYANFGSNELFAGACINRFTSPRQRLTSQPQALAAAIGCIGDNSTFSGGCIEGLLNRLAKLVQSLASAAAGHNRSCRRSKGELRSQIAFRPD